MSTATQPIKTFQEACEALKLNVVLPDVSGLPEKHRKALLAHMQLVIIAEALNEGWTPNWDDLSEWKYYPWFDLEKRTTAGSGISFDDYDYAYTGSHVGSRLCYKTEELAEYAGKTFEGLYRDYFLIEG